MAEEVGPRHRQSPAGVLRPHVGDSLPLRRVLAEHRRRPGGQGLGNEAVPIRGEAGHGHKEVPGPHLPGVIADAGDLQSHIHRSLQDRDALQQCLKSHLVKPPSR